MYLTTCFVNNCISMRVIYFSSLLCIFVTFYPDVTLGGDPLVCTYRHTYKTWDKITFIKDPKVKEPHEKRNWHNMDFIFKLYCHNQIATISYVNHVLDRFKVKSCKPEDFDSAILVPKLPDEEAILDEREVPTSVKIYYVKNGQCYEKRYIIKNWETDVKDYEVKEAGEIEKKDPKKVRCSKEKGLDVPFGDQGQKTHYELDVFGSCKTESFVFPNVYGVRWDVKEFFPSALSLDPPGLRVDASFYDHKKLLFCTYKTKNYDFKILCIKFHGYKYYAAYVGEVDKTVMMERFNVTSCQEHHIVNSIFPPHYEAKSPETVPSHVIKYALYTGKCNLRSYKCTVMGNVLGTLAESTKCPSLDDLDKKVGSVGRWEKCEGPLKSNDIIDLTVD